MTFDDTVFVCSSNSSDEDWQPESEEEDSDDENLANYKHSCLNL